MNSHQHYMRLALAQARLAFEAGEVPVGAVLVSRSGEVLASAYNQVISLNDPTAHAEVLAIRQASQFEQNYRLLGASLYVTLEPCMMCLGAIFQARLAHVVYGAKEYHTGVCGSVLSLNGEKRLNHHTRVMSGVLAEESASLLSEFFRLRRKNGKS